MNEKVKVHTKYCKTEIIDVQKPCQSKKYNEVVQTKAVTECDLIPLPAL